MKKPVILLFHPRTLHEKNYRYYHVPYSILAVASVLDRNKYEVVLIDDNVQQKRSYRNTLVEYGDRLLCVGISSMVGAQIIGGLSFAKDVRDLNLNVPIVWGGPLPTLLPAETTSHELVDISVRGQGEITFQTLVERFKRQKSIDDIRGIAFNNNTGDVHINPPRRFMDLNVFPDYTTVYPLLGLRHYVWPDEHIAERTISYHSSQGCPFSCGFCCEVALWNRWWSGLTATRILNDIQYLVERLAINGIKFYDSEFFVDRLRALDFAKGLLDKGINVRWGASAHPLNIFRLSDKHTRILSKSGLTRLLVGAESGVQCELDFINKKIKKEILFDIAERCARHEIVICFTFIIGYPSMPTENVEKTLSFAEKLRAFEPMHEMKMHIYGPYPGTPLYQKAMDCGFKPPKTLEEWAKHDYYNVLVPWIDQELEVICRKFNETHYPYLHPYKKGRCK